MKHFDVLIVGAGPGGIYSAYELLKIRPELKVAVFERGHALEEVGCEQDDERHAPYALCLPGFLHATSIGDSWLQLGETPYPPRKAAPCMQAQHATWEAMPTA